MLWNLFLCAYSFPFSCFIFIFIDSLINFLVFDAAWEIKLATCEFLIVC